MTITDVVTTVFADPDKRVCTESVAPAVLDDNAVRVRTHYSFISAGTELTQLGLTDHPLAPDRPTRRPLGYSLSGEVVEVGAAVTHVQAGQRVACVGQGAFHASEVVVARNLVIPIPSGVSMHSAAPAAMMCFAIEAVRKAAIEPGENVLVVGAGPMGQLAAQFALGAAGRVYLTDLNQQRLARAGQGVRTFVGDDAGWSQLSREVLPHGIEKVLVCMGGQADGVLKRIYQVMGQSPDGLLQGRIVFSGGATAAIPFASPSGNLQFYSSAKAGPGYRDPIYEAGSDYPAGYVKWTVARNVAVCLDAAAAGRLKIEPLITHEFDLCDAPRAYQFLAEPGNDALMTLLRYDI